MMAAIVGICWRSYGLLSLLNLAASDNFCTSHEVSWMHLSVIAIASTPDRNDCADIFSRHNNFRRKSLVGIAAIMRLTRSWAFAAWVQLRTSVKMLVSSSSAMATSWSNKSFKSAQMSCILPSSTKVVNTCGLESGEGFGNTRRRLHLIRQTHWEWRNTSNLT